MSLGQTAENTTLYETAKATSAGWLLFLERWLFHNPYHRTWQNYFFWYYKAIDMNKHATINFYFWFSTRERRGGLCW